MNQLSLSMSDERIKQYNDNIKLQNIDVATKGVFYTSVITFVFLAIYDGRGLGTFVCVFYSLLTAFAAFFAKRFFDDAMKYRAEIFCIAFLMVVIPVQWFSVGGFQGIGGMWMLFGAIYIMFAVTGELRKRLLVIYGMEFIIVQLLSVYYSELVQSLPDDVLVVASIESIIIVCAYTLYVGINQKIITDEAAVNIALMQDDLTAQNEELIAVNDELIDLTEQLKVANDTQRHFTASMNHELRAPLNGIEGCLQILMMSGKLDKENTETVRNALTASKTINQTVNDLLDFAKLEEGKFDIVKRQFDLRDILDNVSTIFTPQASAKDLEFQIRIPRSTRVSIVADGVRIQQIMTNLISNGIKYTKAGRVTMVVTTGPCRLNITVSDTGQGMAKEELDVLFDPFTRFNMQENVKIQGTGLGMNVVHNLIKEMKGEIDVESVVGEGTTFRVRIPIMFYDSEVTYSTPREQSEEKVDESAIADINLLSVDDMQINRTVIRGLLKNTEVKISEADSGRKAVEACKNTKYDVILLDHMMPEMDGVETMEAIHGDEMGMNKKTPIIMLTGNSGKEYTDLYFSHGASGYLEKPVMYENLIEAIRKACNR